MSFFYARIKGGEGMQKLYTIPELAKHSGINKNLLYDYINAGLVPVIKLKTLKIAEEYWNNFLEKYRGYDLSDPYNPKLLEVKK